MPTVEIPNSIDGAPLGDLRARLARLAALIQREEPLRGADVVLTHAIGAFRLTAHVQRGRWISKRRAILDGGRGPIVPIRQ